MNYFWIDMEMTGLDVEEGRILEIAIVITDDRLNQLDSYHAVLTCPQEILDNMDAWNTRTHNSTGLIKEVPRGKNKRDVQLAILTLADKYFLGKKIILCGNSLHLDRLYIEKEMPQLAERLHYRIIDISSFKAIFQWSLGIKYDRSEGHRATDDVKDSVNELRHYLKLLKPLEVPRLSSINLTHQ